MYMQQALGEGRRARAVSERRNEIKRRMQKAASARWPAAARCFNNRGSTAATAGGGLSARARERKKKRRGGIQTGVAAVTSRMKDEEIERYNLNIAHPLKLSRAALVICIGILN